MNNSSIIEPQKELNVIDSYDVVVIGGGIAGVSAAVAASRNGAKTCIVEKECSLGGLATLGLVVIYLPLCDGNGNQVIGGLGEELLKLSVNNAPGDIPECWKNEASIEERKKERYQVTFNPASYTIALEKLVLENNIKLFYDTRYCNSSISNNNIKAVIVENKSGRSAIKCKMVVDASGDADVCYVSGEKTVSDNLNRKNAWFYSYSNVNNELKLHHLSEYPYIDFPAGSKTYAGDNYNDVSQLMIDGRKWIADKIDSLNKNNKDDFYPAIIPSIPQLRMTRRLNADFELDESDNNKSFKDTIGMTGDWRNSGPVFSIPYKCLIGNKINNLITAGRTISTTKSAWEITRVIPTCAVTGEAAGTACAVALQTNKTLFDINLSELQAKLAANNVILKQRKK